MASDAERRSTTLDREKKRKWGYSVDQVDVFLEKTHALYEDPEPKLTQEDIQRVSFDLERGGYVIDQVDAALARLETAVVDKQTQWDIEHQGRVAWRGRTEQLAQTLYARAERPDRERFSKADQGKPAYDFRQVDRLVTQAVGSIRRGLQEDGGASSGQPAVTSTQVASSVFTRRRGQHGYDERSVDFYLNRVGQVLLRMESFSRLSDSLKDVPAPEPAPSAKETAHGGSVFDRQDVMSGSGTGSHATEAPAPHDGPAPSAATPALVDEPAHSDAQASASAAPAAPMPPSFKPSESFDSLREAEESLFHAPAAEAPSAPSPAKEPSETMFPNSMTAVPAVRAGSEPQPQSESGVDAPAPADGGPSAAGSGEPQPPSFEPRRTPSSGDGAKADGAGRPAQAREAAKPADSAPAMPPSFPPSDAPSFHAMPAQHVDYASGQQANPDSFVFPTTPMVLDEIPAPRHGAAAAGDGGKASDGPSFPPISAPAVPAFPTIPTGGGRHATPQADLPSDDDPAAQAKAYVSRLMQSEFTTTDFEIPKLSFPADDVDGTTDKGGTRA